MEGSAMSAVGGWGVASALGGGGMGYYGSRGILFAQ